MLTQTASAASFRDPDGRLVIHGNRVLRLVAAAGVANFQAFLDSRCGRQLLEEGTVVSTRILPKSDPAAAELTIEGDQPELILEHERIAFPSFPYEWPPEMLHQAAAVTLDLTLRLLPEGIGLKDASPYNILFRGTSPVFIDLLSFERRDPRDTVWLPYAQFVRSFLLPLIFSKYFNCAPHEMLLTHRDGIEPGEIYRWAGPVRRLFPPFLSLVSIPTWLSSRSADREGIYHRQLSDSPDQAAFILRRLLTGLQRHLDRAAPEAARKSTWTGYLAANSYSEPQFAAKQAFVEWALETFRPGRVLDIGCNTGFFSAVSGRSGASVVSIDSDPVVVGETWRRARSEGLDILPLVVDITRPTPSVGWRNRECAGFLDRARGSFDVVLMLAIIHHMMVTERIPLEEIIDLAGELTRDVLIVEFVGPGDAMFQRLTRGRDHLHRELNHEVFEKAAQARFHIVRCEPIEGSERRLYALRKYR